ncbi:hypothetical protein [Mucilaginibacter sp. KACC 22063]|uniref:hypothetical protein n=1 Tax=Mucilaginibacter sp. KACC 22063 TaxID=3025666 RepID=UPI0023661293|nr:hypothetical protein [Mucilaginibacter sp. KACC 22063]WDF57307.1 hypothetical protein PQ461_09600 [Mucilaginibacter sp. KACC 22063]
MILRKGIGLINSLKQQQDAIMINSGICYAAQENIPEVSFRKIKFTPQFQEGAILAKSDWCSLSDKDLHILKPGNKITDYNTIFLGDLPDSLIKRFKKLPLHESETVDDIYAIFRKHEVLAKKLNNDLNIFLNTIADNKPYKFRCFGVSFPNLLSVSAKFYHLPKNHAPTDVQYIGFHNDCTTAMSIHTAHRYGNRISINFGREEREFLFVNLSLIQAYNMIKAKNPESLPDVNLVTIPQIFFKLFPNYPILKVKLKPYQYYIAPTDNCFHDGRTLGNKTFDMTMIFFGGFCKKLTLQ